MLFRRAEPIFKALIGRAFEGFLVAELLPRESQSTASTGGATSSASNNCRNLFENKGACELFWPFPWPGVTHRSAAPCASSLAFAEDPGTQHAHRHFVVSFASCSFEIPKLQGRKRPRGKLLIRANITKLYFMPPSEEWE
jgi:hypothetical protein